VTDTNQGGSTANNDPSGAAATPTASYDELSGGVASISNAPLETLLDVSLPVTIEFGRTKMSVQEVLQLGRGSIIQLERVVGEPVDIYVSDRKLAEGEVVVIGEYFGVRITTVMGVAKDGGDAG
jgi:flagellar motor switch protein FliN/FliY